MQRSCYCQTCGRKVELSEDEAPCEALMGWIMLSQLKGTESVERHSFCSYPCAKIWVDSQIPEIPPVFLESMGENPIQP
jgi:hypothetical protein